MPRSCLPPHCASWHLEVRRPRPLPPTRRRRAPPNAKGCGPCNLGCRRVGIEPPQEPVRNRCPPAAAKKARSLAALQRPQKAPTPARAAGVAETDRKTQLRHWPTAKIAPRYSRCNAFAAPRRSRRSRRPQKRCRTKPRSEAMRNAAKQLRRCQNALSRL